jgi:hypothetical protein
LASFSCAGLKLILRPLRPLQVQYMEPRSPGMEVSSWGSLISLSTLRISAATGAA